MRPSTNRKLGVFGAVMTAAIFAVFTGVTVIAVGPYANSVTYGGQGLIADGFGGYDLITEICGVANGADADGPYLLWVLTATGAKNADITGPWGTVAMTKTGAGTFKYVSGWYAPQTLPGYVTATYDGKVKNAQLTISHGCRPFTHSAWCSPGFWNNATDAAWALTGYTRTSLFNTTVVPNFYDTPFTGQTLTQGQTTYTLDNPTLGTTLGNPYTNGQLTSAPYGLTPFNATGAFLTDNIPGFDFDPTFVGQDDSQTCPIDHFGNFKNP
jgi:hypothetical protein